MFEIPCIIFAGGKSSRMGEDKTLLPFGGYSTLCEFQYKRLKQIFNRVYIVTKEPSKFPFEANFLEESYSVFAPTAGFVTLFGQLSDEAFFVLSVDTPFIDFAIIEQIFLEYKKTNQTTLAKLHNKIEPLCGIYTRSLEQEFVKMLQNNEHKLSKMLQMQHISFVTFKEEKKFFNLNYQDDYIKAREMNLTHLDEKDRPKMVDVSSKDATTRVAIASGKIQMSQEAYENIVNEQNKKGPVLQTAVIAAIMGVKQTSTLIPMCHPLNLSGINCDVEEIPELPGFKLIVTTKLTGQTGVEMEALTGVSVGLLTIYDMVKAIDKGMVLHEIQLEKKSGGKNGDYQR